MWKTIKINQLWNSKFLASPKEWRKNFAESREIKIWTNFEWLPRNQNFFERKQKYSEKRGREIKIWISPLEKVAESVELSRQNSSNNNLDH